MPTMCNSAGFCWRLVTWLKKYHIKMQLSGQYLLLFTNTTTMSIFFILLSAFEFDWIFCEFDIGYWFCVTSLWCDSTTRKSDEGADTDLILIFAGQISMKFNKNRAWRFRGILAYAMYQNLKYSFNILCQTIMYRGSTFTLPNHTRLLRPNCDIKMPTTPKTQIWKAQKIHRASRKFENQWI